MAKYLSKFSKFKKTVRKGEQMLTASPAGPQMQLVREPIIALFQQAIVTSEERDDAFRHFGFRGVADGEDDPGRRVSGYDTEEAARNYAWDEETLAEVERVLDAGVGSDYYRIEHARLAAPWPRYDELTAQGRRTVEICAQQIQQTVEQLGLDPDAVSAYERENLNRPEVLVLLEKPAPVEDEAILVDA